MNAPSTDTPREFATPIRPAQEDQAQATDGETSTAPKRIAAHLSKLPRASVAVAALLVIALLLGTAILLTRSRGTPVTTEPTPIERLGNRVDQLEKSVDQRIESLRGDLATRTTEIDVNTNERFLEQTKRIDALEILAATAHEEIQAIHEQTRQQIVELAQIKSRVEAALSKPAAKPKPGGKSTRAKPTLPFRLVSTDLWDGVAYAGLSHDGRIELVRENQAHAGWRVASIDIQTQQAVFRNSRGTKVTATIGR